MVEEKFKKQLEGDKYAGYQKIAKKIGKDLYKAGQKVEKGISTSIEGVGNLGEKTYKEYAKKRITYRSGNPLKGLLAVKNRPTVKISGKKENINLMKASW